MTKLGIAINLDRCVGCHTCSNACKMSNNVPMGMLWNRILTEGVDVMERRAPTPTCRARTCPSSASTAKTPPA